MCAYLCLCILCVCTREYECMCMQEDQKSTLGIAPQEPYTLVLDYSVLFSFYLFRFMSVVVCVYICMFACGWVNVHTWILKNDVGKHSGLFFQLIF